MSTVSSDPPNKAAALQGAAYYLPSAAGCLRIHGPDQITFLQRQTTNDLRLLVPGTALVTVLVSPSARILDVFHVFIDGDALGAITLPGRAPETTRFLKSRIFFMDKVSLADLSVETAQIDLEGPLAAQVLPRLGFASTPGPGELVEKSQDAGTWRLLHQSGLAGPGFKLLLPAPELPGVAETLRQAGIPQLSPESHHVLRVEAGLPAAGAELSDAYTPLETGLAYAVSDNKGCYTGQEVIARQITYDKITQRLAGLRLEAPLSAPSRLWADSKPAGEITSTALSPRFGPIALAVVKRPHFAPGTQLHAGDGPSAALRAEVVELPFH